MIDFEDGAMPSSHGRLVGRYVVHDRIAAGGMATVHVGRLLGAAGFSRTVAVKRLHDQYACDPDFVAMLLDEARLASQIRHPNVVPTLDVVAEQNELLVVMEYVEGDSVAHLVKIAGRIPEAIAASVVAQMLHGLHAAHEAHDRDGEPLGIVHRDVSPQNVLVGTDGVARVLDFGIARAASRSSSTDDGIVKGKTAYMAPEQVQHGAIDRRTDIFAAGVMLWELLSGKRLFFADSPAQAMAKVLTMPIESPACDAALAAITMMALERDPEKRWATAEEMATALEESIVMPRAKEIGAFVTETAHEILAQRADVVNAVTRSSHKMEAALTTDPELRKAIEEAERRRAFSELSTDVGQLGQRLGQVEERTDLATVNSAIAPVVRRRGTTALIIALALGLIGAIAVIVVTRRERDAITVTSPPPVEEARPIPSASVSAALPKDDKPAPKPSASASATAKPIPKPTAKKPDCRVPFVIDKDGQKHFKEECVD